jgi:hypothetical protein
MWTLLLKFWKEIALVLIVLGAWFYVQNLRSTVEDQKSEIRVLKATNEVLVANEKVLQSAIDSVNEAFVVIGDYDEANKKRFAELQKSITSSSSVISTHLTTILKEKTPKTCEETIQYLIDASKEYKK